MSTRKLTADREGRRAQCPGERLGRAAWRSGVAATGALGPDVGTQGLSPCHSQTPRGLPLSARRLPPGGGLPEGPERLQTSSEPGAGGRQRLASVSAGSRPDRAPPALGPEVPAGGPDGLLASLSPQVNTFMSFVLPMAVISILNTVIANKLTVMVRQAAEQGQACTARGKHSSFSMAIEPGRIPALHHGVRVLRTCPPGPLRGGGSQGSAEPRGCTPERGKV